jgi:hypothetical protein
MPRQDVTMAVQTERNFALRKSMPSKISLFQAATEANAESPAGLLKGFSHERLSHRMAFRLALTMEPCRRAGPWCAKNPCPAGLARLGHTGRPEMTGWAARPSWPCMAQFRRAHPAHGPRALDGPSTKETTEFGFAGPSLIGTSVIVKVGCRSHLIANCLSKQGW